QLFDQRLAALESVEPGYAVERLRVDRQRVGLAVKDHLQAVLDRPQPVVAFTQQDRIIRRYDALGRQRVERRARAADPHRRVAAAMDQLVRLGEEFDLANPPAPLLEVIARSGFDRPIVIVADPRGQAADFLDCGEVETAPPDKRRYRFEKGL